MRQLFYCLQWYAGKERVKLGLVRIRNADDNKVATWNNFLHQILLKTLDLFILLILTKKSTCVLWLYRRSVISTGLASGQQGTNISSSTHWPNITCLSTFYASLKSRMPEWVIIYYSNDLCVFLKEFHSLSGAKSSQWVPDRKNQLTLEYWKRKLILHRS